MAINQLSTANTFEQWLVATQSLIAFANSITDSGGVFTSNTVEYVITGNLTVGNTVTCVTMNTDVIIFDDGTRLASNVQIVNAYAHSNGAFNKANSANVLAQQSFDEANAINTFAISSFSHANSSFDHANSAFNKANSANVLAQAAFDYANGITAGTSSSLNVLTANTATIGNLHVTKTLTEAVTTTGSVSTNTHNINLALTNIFDITLANNVTFTFTNPPAAGIAKSCTIVLRQDAVGNRTATFANTKYTDGVQPVFSTGANQIDVLSFFTIDGGTNYFGTFAMANVA